MNNQKNCIHCGKLIIGREDKKFCDADCRNSFNNKHKRESEKHIIEINRILRKNRRILQQLNPEGKSTVRKSLLNKLKFDFNYHTHSFTTKNNFTYIFCYEFGYMEIMEGDKEKVIIINEQPYMKQSPTNYGLNTASAEHPY